MELVDFKVSKISTPRYATKRGVELFSLDSQKNFTSFYLYNVQQFTYGRIFAWLLL
jgi:hypothetical protein